MRGSWGAVLAALFVLAAPAQAQEKEILRIGWEQDPQTLSPFTDQDEESYRIWAINYDLLVNFSLTTSARRRASPPRGTSPTTRRPSRSRSPAA